MATFTAQASVVQSADGLTLTLKDDSLYGDLSEQDYTTANFTRAFVLTNADTTPIATVPITGSALTVPYSITVDQWIIIQLVLTGIDPTPNFDVTVQFGADRITKNLFRTLLQQGCCPNHVIDKRLELADQYLEGASIEQLAGNGAGFNTDIASASSYLNAPKF